MTKRRNIFRDGVVIGKKGVLYVVKTINGSKIVTRFKLDPINSSCWFNDNYSISSNNDVNEVITITWMGKMLHNFLLPLLLLWISQSWQVLFGQALDELTSFDLMK